MDPRIVEIATAHEIEPTSSEFVIAVLEARWVEAAAHALWDEADALRRAVAHVRLLAGVPDDVDVELDEEGAWRAA